MSIINFLKSKFRINVKADLNKERLIKNLSGITALGFGACSTYEMAQEKYKNALIFGVAGGVFGGIYTALDEEDKSWEYDKWMHEERMEEIKHPRSSSSEEDTDALVKRAYAKYLQDMDRKPSSATLNELAHASGVDVVPLSGGLLYSGDVAMFFSIANKGKTILGVQMAIDIARGESTIIPCNYDLNPQDVIYLNFEMSTSQMKKRLAPHGEDNVITFPYNLVMRDCKGCFENSDKFLEYVANEAENLGKDTVIFVDTITDICPQFFNKESSKVMNSLRNIQAHAFKEKGITITFILMGHTNKMHIWDPICMEDLKGGGNQANLADSMFAMGTTNLGKSVRYLKSIKNRNGAVKDEVDLIEIVDDPYLHFIHRGESLEEDVLPRKPKPKANNLFSSLCMNDEDEIEQNEWTGAVPLDVAREMYEWYQEGVSGHGWAATAKKFGLRHAEEAKRIIHEYIEYIEEC